MKVIIGVMAALFILFIGVLGFYIHVRNGLVGKDEQAEQAWAQIDAQLQRRMDLVPNLVSTVKGYAKHEKDIFESVASARTSLITAKTPGEKADADARLTGALGRLLAISERYPDLKAGANFIRLQDELAGTENRIAVARTRYNDAVKDFNMVIRQFPGSLFAPGMGLRERGYYKPSDPEKAKAPPEVKF
jgi:LemA protein